MLMLALFTIPTILFSPRFLKSRRIWLILLPTLRRLWRVGDNVLHYSIEGWRRLFDIHPKSEAQFRMQQGFSQIPFVGDAYANHMRNKSLFERNNQFRSNVGLPWSSIKLPWIAGATQGNPMSGVSNLTPQVSANLEDLYEDSEHAKKERVSNPYVQVGPNSWIRSR